MTSIRTCTALTMKPAGSGPLGIGLPWAKAPCGAPLRDGPPREQRTRACSGCGAIEKDTQPCFGDNYVDAHMLFGGVPDYCGPFEPPLKPVHEDSALDQDHEAVSG